MAPHVLKPIAPHTHRCAGNGMTHTRVQGVHGGHDNLFFAGAWTGYGFHEDGLKSAIAIARSLNIEIPWQSDVAAYPMQDEEEREIA